MTSFLKKLQHYLMFLFLKSIIPLFIIIRLWHSYTLIQPFISGKFTWQQKNSGGFIKFPPLFRGMTPWCFLHSWHEQVGKVLQRKAYSRATKRFWNYQIVRVAICLYVIPESVKLRTFSQNLGPIWRAFCHQIPNGGTYIAPPNPLAVGTSH